MSTVDHPSEHVKFLQGTPEVLILRLQAGPNGACGMSQFPERQSGDEFLVDNGSLYPALQRLLGRAWFSANVARRAAATDCGPIEMGALRGGHGADPGAGGLRL